VAAALAQEPAVLLLDEPTTFLDIKHQLAIQRILRDLCNGGMLVVAATHDLNLAAAYSDRIVVLNRGRVVADGPPSESLTAEKIRDVFEVEAYMEQTPEGGSWIRYAE